MAVDHELKNRIIITSTDLDVFEDNEQQSISRRVSPAISNSSGLYLDVLNRNFSSSRTSFSSLCSNGKEGIQHSAVNIDKTLTWVSFILPENNINTDTVIVFIPGNPGAIEFYDSFIENLFKQCGMPIFGISHAGHNLVPSRSCLVDRVCKELYPDVKPRNKQTYTLEEQISHKLAFIRQYIDPNKKIILIAHSLGSYISLQMLKRMKTTKQIEQIILLFPVFERTMETSSGKFWVPLTQMLMKPVIKTTRVVEMLPPSVKKSLIDHIAHKRKFSLDSMDSLTAGIASLVTPSGLRNMAQIARDLSKIGSIGDLEPVIQKHQNRITFYYGANDTWTPLNFYQDLKAKFPKADIRLDGHGIDHAFVLNYSKLVAPIVCDIIKERIMTTEIETGSIRSIDSYHDQIYHFSFKRSRSYKSGRRIYGSFTGSLTHNNVNN